MWNAKLFRAVNGNVWPRFELSAAHGL
jgi:hypothetical protein